MSDAVDTERKRIIAEARRILSEINAIFSDAQHWNEHVRAPRQLPIDVDPDGQLAAARKGIEGILNKATP